MTVKKILIYDFQFFLNWVYIHVLKLEVNFQILIRIFSIFIAQKTLKKYNIFKVLDVL